MVVSFAALLIALAMATAIGFGLLVVMAKLGRTILGRSDSPRTCRSHFRTAGRFLFFTGVLVFLPFFIFVVRSGHAYRGRVPSISVTVDGNHIEMSEHTSAHDHHAVEVRNSIRSTMKEIEEARETIRGSIEAIDGHSSHSLVTDSTSTISGSASELAPAVPQAPLAPATPTLPAESSADVASTTYAEVDVEVVSVETKPDRKSTASRRLLGQLASQIGQAIVTRTMQSGADTESAKPVEINSKPNGSIAEPSNSNVTEPEDTAKGEVFVVQLPQEILTELMKSHGHELPESISQIYALIPLTTAGGNLITPAGQPLRAVEGMQTLAEALATAIANSAKSSQLTEHESVEPADSQTDVAGAEITATTSTLTTSEVTAAESLSLAELPGSDDVTSIPSWIRSPDGGRLVIETAFRPAGEDVGNLLREELNSALTDHLTKQSSEQVPAGTNWHNLVRLHLSDAAALECVVATYDRLAVIETQEGTKQMAKTFALVEFPEAIDKAAMLQIRQAVQSQRMLAVLVVAAIIWLTVLSSGLIFRFAAAGRRVRMFAAVPVFALIPLPLAMVATGLIIGMSTGEMIDWPWSPATKTVTLNPPVKQSTSSKQKSTKTKRTTASDVEKNPGSSTTVSIRLN